MFVPSSNRGYVMTIQHHALLSTRLSTQRTGSDLESERKLYVSGQMQLRFDPKIYPIWVSEPFQQCYVSKN